MKVRKILDTIQLTDGQSNPVTIRLFSDPRYLFQKYLIMRQAFWITRKVDFEALPRRLLDRVFETVRRGVNFC